MRHPLRRERGAILAWAGLLLLMLFAFAVVAVDVGRVAFTANEVQSIADIAATAGATAAWEGGNAVAQAQSVVALNTVDGATASIDENDVVLGRYDTDTATFTPGAWPTNAVRANAMATVNNILAMVFGTSETTVAKTSTAMVATVASGTPTLPLAIGECQFQNLCPTCLPRLTQAPNEDNNSAWTGFFREVEDGSDVTKFMPESCGGTGTAVPELRVGDTIKLANRLDSGTSAALTAIKCQVDAGQRDFVVPVVAEGEDSDERDDESDSDDRDDDSRSDDGTDDCSHDEDSHSEEGFGYECDGSLDSSGHVVGFATVRIDRVVTSGDSKGITLHGVFNAGLPGKPGGDCENCGTGHAVLVK